MIRSLSCNCDNKSYTRRIEGKQARTNYGARRKVLGTFARALLSGTRPLAPFLECSIRSPMAGLDSFLFIVSTDPATFKCLSTQNRIRKHASRSACKSRRAKFVLERHNPRQFPPEMQLHSSQAVEPNFLEDFKIPALISPEDRSLENTKTAKVDAENAATVASAPEFVGLVSTEPHPRLRMLTRTRIQLAASVGTRLH